MSFSGHIAVVIAVFDSIHPLRFVIITASHATLQVWSFDDFKALAHDPIVGGLWIFNHFNFGSC